MLPFRAFADPTDDTYVDEADPDANFGDADQVFVRSEDGAARRVLVEFDTHDVMPGDIDAITTLGVEEATLRAVPDEGRESRDLECYNVAAFDTDEDTNTWNDHPTPSEGVLEDTVTSSEDVHEWDVTSALITQLEEGDPGPVAFLIVDASEDADRAEEQAYASKEGTGPTFELEVQQNLVARFSANADTYVDEADGGGNFEQDGSLFIRTEASANKRTLVELPFSGLPSETLSLDRVQARLRVQSNVLGRTLEARAPDTDADLETVTWDDQPTLGGVLATTVSDDGSTHEWDSDVDGSGALLDEVDGRFQDGDAAVQLVMLDETEGETIAVEQAYDSIEGGTGPSVRFELRDFAWSEHVSSTVLVKRVADLSSSVTPIPVEDLPSRVLPWSPGLPTLTSVVEVAPIPIDPHAGKATGRVTIELDGALDDVREIFDEVGVALDVGGETHRAVVQLLEDAAGLPTVRSGSPVELSRGDAVLFALGDGSVFTPVTTITWLGYDWQITGTLDAEQVTDEMLFREVGLRRLAAVDECRVIGTVQQTDHGDLFSEVEVP